MSASTNKKELDYGDSDCSDEDQAKLHSNSTDTDDKVLSVLFEKEPATIVKRDFIPRGKLDEDDVNYAAILELRRDAMGYFRDQVTRMMVAKLHTLNVRDRNGDKVRNMKELNKYVSHKRYLSVHLMEILFCIFYGTFDQNKGKCLYLLLKFSN